MPERSDIDVDALGSLTGAEGEPAGRRLTRKERRAAKRQAKADAREAKRQAKARSKEYTSIKRQLKEALNSVLPLGYNHIDVSRYSTTAEITMLMPFATQELADEGGNYCGQNKHSRNLVFCDRKKLASPMGFMKGSFPRHARRPSCESTSRSHPVWSSSGRKAPPSRTGSRSASITVFSSPRGSTPRS